MKTLVLKNKYQSNVTLITNEFIDRHMPKANGEFVKVFLFLLRHLNDPCANITIPTIADCLDNTEKDILRALRYWETEGLICVEKDEEERISSIEMVKTPCASTPIQEVAPAEIIPDLISSLPVQTVPDAIPLTSFKAQKELKSLLYIAEQYLGKTLSATEMDVITYLYNDLKMSNDLIEYLLESCVDNGHKSIHYIQKVAISWIKDGITTVTQAKHRTMTYNRNCYTVLNSFGIKNRGPATSEITFIKKWTEDFSFSIEIIQEACRRTIAAIHQPSFEYADTILENWHQHNVRQLSDIEAVDIAFRHEQEGKKVSEGKSREATKNFNNFDARPYDWDTLEQQLLNSN